MTRRHYRKIAAIIQDAKEFAAGPLNHSNAQIISKIQVDLAIVLAEDNPRFDLGKFNQACSVSPPR